MKKNYTYILIGCLVFILAGCETFSKMDQAIGRNQVRLQDFFASIFLAETESVNFAVRIRHEFFVYLPPMDDAEQGVNELSSRIMTNLAESRIDTLIDQDLEKQARIEGVEELRYLETDKFRVFIEPRFLSFEYCDGNPPVFAVLKEGLYALTMQTQIIIRDKRNGQEVWRQTVTAQSLEHPHILAEFGNSNIFQSSLASVSALTAEEVLKTLKDRKPILASKERYASIYHN